mmetsp:Transcript_27059/g.40668  ORF Transcript_27059/g.40668 Transcript_27059/m.40668 type:complete len:100 (+) Transcript_27059:395-694(+)
MMSTTISASTSKMKTMNEKGEEQQQKEKYQMYLNFKWSIGSNNCDKENDTLSMSVPIEMVRKQNQVGGNVRLSWQQQQLQQTNPCHKSACSLNLLLCNY